MTDAEYRRWFATNAHCGTCLHYFADWQLWPACQHPDVRAAEAGPGYQCGEGYDPSEAFRPEWDRVLDAAVAWDLDQLAATG